MLQSALINPVKTKASENVMLALSINNMTQPMCSAFIYGLFDKYLHNSYHTTLGYCCKHTPLFLHESITTPLYDNGIFIPQAVTSSEVICIAQSG